MTLLAEDRLASLPALDSTGSGTSSNALHHPAGRNRGADRGIRECGDRVEPLELRPREGRRSPCRGRYWRHAGRPYLHKSWGGL